MVKRLPPAVTPRFAQERQQQIAQALREQGRVEVSLLAAQYAVSEDTIRRDLRLLVAHGLVQKTHGGAVSLQAAVLPASERAGVLQVAKRAIAQAALAHVQPHQTLFIDAGSTTLAFAQALRAQPALRPLTVLTSSLDVALALLDEPRLQLLLTGGEWLADARIFCGAPAEATLRAHRADLALLGACALHARLGLSTHHAGDAALKRAMVDGAASRIVLADASKLDSVAAHAVCGWDAIDRVVCDRPPAWLRQRAAVDAA